MYGTLHKRRLSKTHQQRVKSLKSLRYPASPGPSELFTATTPKLPSCRPYLNDIMGMYGIPQLILSSTPQCQSTRALFFKDSCSSLSSFIERLLSSHQTYNNTDNDRWCLELLPSLEIHGNPTSGTPELPHPQTPVPAGARLVTAVRSPFQAWEQHGFCTTCNRVCHPEVNATQQCWPHVQWHSPIRGWGNVVFAKPNNKVDKPSQ